MTKQTRKQFLREFRHKVKQFGFWNVIDGYQKELNTIRNKRIDNLNFAITKMWIKKS